MAKSYHGRYSEEDIETLKKLGTKKIMEIIKDYFKNVDAPKKPEPKPICKFLAEDPKDFLYVWCDEKRIPITVCQCRQKRYDENSATCYPKRWTLEAKKLSNPDLEPELRKTYPTLQVPPAKTFTAEATTKHYETGATKFWCQRKNNNPTEAELRFYPIDACIGCYVRSCKYRQFTKLDKQEI
jgi:hypothetical protein